MNIPENVVILLFRDSSQDEKTLHSPAWTDAIFHNCHMFGKVPRLSLYSKNAFHQVSNSSGFNGGTNRGTSN